MKITFLQGPDAVTAQFHGVRHLFERVTGGAAHGEFTVQDLERLAMGGQMIIGVVTDEEAPILAVALEFIPYPQYLVLNIAALAGSPGRSMRDVLLEYRPALQEFARSAGAAYIQASCSPAMARMLSRFGFDETYRTVRSKL